MGANYIKRTNWLFEKILVEEEEANFCLLVLHLFKDLAWFK